MCHFYVRAGVGADAGVPADAEDGAAEIPGVVRLHGPSQAGNQGQGDARAPHRICILFC